MQDLKKGLQFVALFKSDKKLVSPHIGYIIVGNDRKIRGISSNSVNLIKLDNRRLSRMNLLGIDMTKLCPDVFDLDLQ